MTNSSLSKRNLCETKDSNTNARPFSNIERLEQACWDGMLEEFLPGLVECVEGKTLLLWEIQTANSFLHIDLCDRPCFSQKERSIDPYLFINHLYYN